MRSFSWVFRPRRIYIYNFESSNTGYIADIVVMPVNWQEKVRASTKKSAAVKLSSDTDPSKIGHGQSRELRMKWGEAEQFGGKMHTAIITVKAFYN